jgi:hypothetical protein
MRVECTFLGSFGLPQSYFKQQLFGLSSIQSYINGNKNNVIICEFEDDEAQAMSTLVAVPPMSQFSQLSQMSQYAANHLDMGVCNFGVAYGMPPIHMITKRECQLDLALVPWDSTCEINQTNLYECI